DAAAVRSGDALGQRRPAGEEPREQELARQVLRVADEALPIAQVLAADLGAHGVRSVPEIVAHDPQGFILAPPPLRLRYAAAEGLAVLPALRVLPHLPEDHFTTVHLAVQPFLHRGRRPLASRHALAGFEPGLDHLLAHPLRGDHAV